MLLLISPAKTLNETPTTLTDYTQPQLLEETDVLVKKMRTLNSVDIQALMKVSEKIADLNVERYQKFSLPFNLDNAKQAVLAFKGDVYQGLDAETLTKEELDFAQQHLGILSGLYGLLKPLDLMQPYRLEMGSKLKTPNGKNLYDYWDKTISLTINKLSEDTNSKALVNCASQEYFQAIDLKALVPQIITPVFMEHRKGENKIISFFAKKARGLMARYIIKNKITKKDDLKNFNSDGYVFNKELSSDNKLMFIRKSSS